MVVGMPTNQMKQTGEATKMKKEEIQGKNTRQIKNQNGILGKDDFMKLLMAEMRYQDPLSPMKNTDSIAQLAQFSSLEQTEKLNKSFENLTTNQQITNMSAAAQFIGKVATAYTDKGEIKGLVKSSVMEDGKILCKIFDGENETSIEASKINKLENFDTEAFNKATKEKQNSLENSIKQAPKELVMENKKETVVMPKEELVKEHFKNLQQSLPVKKLSLGNEPEKRRLKDGALNLFESNSKKI